MQVRISDTTQATGERIEGSITFDYLAFSTLPTASGSASSDALILTTKTTTSSTEKADVNRDGDVTGLDALLVINYMAVSTLQAEGIGLSSYTLDFDGRFDTNQDGKVSALDALFVITSIGNQANDLVNTSPAEKDPWLESVDDMIAKSPNDDDDEGDELIELLALDHF